MHLSIYVIGLSVNNILILLTLQFNLLGYFEARDIKERLTAGLLYVLHVVKMNCPLN